LFERVPSGVCSAWVLNLSMEELRRVELDGARWAVSNGYGSETDLEYIEEGGRIDGADPEQVSERAMKRGRTQVGTLGSGNHFLEVGYVARSEEHTSELRSRENLVCRLLLEKKKISHILI